MGNIRKIGLGGGCHWCTEAVFQSLKGVAEVEQGYIASSGEASAFSEGVVVHFDPESLPLEILIEIHLHTHKSTSQHSFRDRYRSAVYVFSDAEAREAGRILHKLQQDFSERIITRVLPFRAFEASREEIQDYYLSGPERPFCQRYIEPKLQFLVKHYAEEMKK